ncbi:MAG: hypothetical protein U0531_10005 [Dehalococcoidia bacterium]
MGGCHFNEHYIFRDLPTDKQRLVRAETLLHEMAHVVRQPRHDEAVTRSCG